jgi:putative SOS response-associated peptidase YedK
MCDRYVLPDQLAAEREFLPAQAWWKFGPKFNVAPHQYVPSIRLHDGQSEGSMVRWGMIPSWAEGKPTGRPTVYADIARIERSKIFRMPWLSGQRCILPVAGFYVWHLTDENYRQPYFVRLINRAVFGLAAVWDRSVTEEDDDVIESCTVVRVPANDLLAGITSSSARMPAILRRRDYQTWLQGTPSQAKGTLQPYNPAWMQAYPVSPRINSTQPDDENLITPVH